MSELQEVLRAIEEGAERGQEMALATIVAIRGSTYRREGARLLVPADGAPVGTISGGCLEGEVCTIAEEVMAERRPRLLHFDLTADDEAVWGWGLGCNGVIDVFVEPAERAVQMAGAIRRAIDEERELVSVTVIRAAEDGAAVRPGARILAEPDGSTEGSLGDAEMDAAARDAAAAALRDGTSRTVNLTDDVEAFVEVLTPPIRLLVCGAGHDAVPLVRFAAGLGWRVEVADDRAAFLTHERFPEARGFVRTEPGEVSDRAAVDHRTYAVVMTHNFMRDKDYLRSFLGSPAPYVGMLGPNERFQKLLAELRREGFEPRPEDLAVVHSPAGLDVGAEGPEEIAWALTAEVLAVRSGRGAGFLRDRRGPIHDLPHPAEVADPTPSPARA